ncbi:MAG: LysR substrate-binding domain-containing protein [Luteibaculaceae bacterium]
MNIQQFQYILAVAEVKHFELAAERCFITQSTLSTMISKFEDEIGIKIFDRKRKPVQITLEGALIIEQIKQIQNNIDQLTELTKEIKGEISGSLALSVIPTIAPFLLPLFLQDFAALFPNLKITVREEHTSEIQRKLKSRELDIGIVSTPLNDPQLLEFDLYKEPFLFYDANTTHPEPINVDAIDLSNLCLMEEGHCMRTQVLQLCEESLTNSNSKLNFEYKAGSIGSLLGFVRVNKGSTLLPYFATLGFSNQEKMHLSEFSGSVPYRTVGLVVHKHFVKNKILDILEKTITNKIAALLPRMEKKGKMLNPLALD